MTDPYESLGFQVKTPGAEPQVMAYNLVDASRVRHPFAGLR